MNRLRITAVRRSRTRPRAIYSVLAIQKLQPYSAWLLMLVGVYIAEKLLMVTIFAELSLLLPYVRYYLYYRLFRQLMRCDFLWVNRQIKAYNLSGLRERGDVTARALGLTALGIVSFLKVIESLIRRGLIYHIVSSTLHYLVLLLILGVTYQWRAVIGAGLAKLIQGPIRTNLAAWCNGRWGILLACPAFVVLILLLLIHEIRIWSRHFEFTKRIAAELFRFQLGSGIDKERAPKLAPVATRYRECFALAGVSGPDQLVVPAITY